MVSWALWNFWKMSMKSEGQRKKCWISGTFPQYLNGENYRQPWDLNDKTRRLNCFFCPNLAEIDAMPPFFRSHAITFTATGLTGYHHLAAIIHKDFNWPATNDFATLCHPQCKRIRENSTMQVQGVLQWASNRFISVLLNKLCLCLHNDWNWPWALRNWKRFKLSCQRRTCCAEIGSARKWHPGAATGRFHRSTKRLADLLQTTWKQYWFVWKTSKPWFPRIKTWGSPIQTTIKWGEHYYIQHFLD